MWFVPKKCLIKGSYSDGIQVPNLGLKTGFLPFEWVKFFQSQNLRTQFSYFQDYLALKWTNIHKKSSILETHEFVHEKQILLF